MFKNKWWYTLILSIFCFYQGVYFLIRNGGHPLKDGSPITFTGSRTRCAQTACSLFPLKSITSAALQWDFPSAFIFCNILKTDGAKRFHYSMFDVGRSMFDVYLFIPSVFHLPPFSLMFVFIRSLQSSTFYLAPFFTFTQ